MTENSVGNTTSNGGPTTSRLSAGIVPYLMSLPALAIICMGLLIPMAAMVDMSLRETYPGGAYSIGNYLQVFKDPYLAASAMRSILLAATVTVVSAVVGFPIAWFLARSTSRLKPLAYLAVVAPLLVSIVVRTIGWTILLGNVGLLNNALLWLGAVDEPLRFLGTFWAVAVAMTHVLLPFMVLSISAVLTKIDRVYSEAAATLGASRIRTFLSVTLPLSAPGLAAGSVIVFCLTIGSYITPAWIGRGRVDVLPLSIYQQMVIYVDWPTGTAAALIVAFAALAASCLIALALRVLSR